MTAKLLSRPECTVAACTRPATRTGNTWCEKHYYRNRRTGSPTGTKPRTPAEHQPGNPCLVDGCESLSVHRGICLKHYTRWLRTGTTDAGPCAHGTPEERFWRHVTVGAPDECWEWDGARHPFGYGQSGQIRAHRLSYEIHHGPIPDGLLVRHSCDNPPCVITGTEQDNVDDCISHGRTWWQKRDALR